MTQELETLRAKQIAFLIEAQKSSLEREKMITRQIERLAEIHSQQSQVMQKLTDGLGKLADNLASTNAALERMERVVDYLMKRDGEISRSDGLDKS